VFLLVPFDPVFSSKEHEKPVSSGFQKGPFKGDLRSLFLSLTEIFLSS